MMMIKICNFVEWELQKFREECNFTEEELEYFNLKAKDMTNTAVALKMNISEPKVSVLARKVRKKIMKVL